LLSEVYSQISVQEFVEVVNPTATAVALDNYYLADTPLYAGLPAGAPAVHARDFIVQFPPGASIGPGEVIVVARFAEGFVGRYGAAPDYSIVDNEGGPEMLAASVGATPDLADVGEGIVLFYWDGLSDVVDDVHGDNL
jgi:hypothetical protein